MILEKALTEQGFVFLAGGVTPFWVTLWNDESWVFRWNIDGQHWECPILLKPDEHRIFPRNLTEEQQRYYHDLHLRCVEEE